MGVIAACFHDAVLDFCKLTTPLRFDWTKFIPWKAADDTFWTPLRDMIIQNLKGDNVFVPQSESTLLSLSKLRWVDEVYRDGDARFLLRDLKQHLYLSANYKMDSDLRRDLGVQALSLSQFLDCLESDILSPDSWWKARAVAKGVSTSLPLSESKAWYGRVCRILLEAFESCSPGLEKVKRLDIIPLANGRFVTPNWAVSRNVYLPLTDGIPVPEDLSLYTVHRIAASGVEQKKLYLYLNVKECLPEIVFHSVHGLFEEQNKSGKADWQDLQHSVCHLGYLCHYKKKLLSPLRFPFIDENMNFIRRNKHVYFPDTSTYGPIDLFESRNASQKFSACFLHPEYLKLNLNTGHRSLQELFSDLVDVKVAPQLRNTQDSGISAELKYVKKHRADQIVGLLHAHWDVYEPQIPKVRKFLRQCSVPVENGSLMALESTVLPCASLKGITTRFGIQDFPYLQLPRSSDDQDLGQWTFLSRFDVIIAPTTTFYLLLLERFQNSSSSREHSSEFIEPIFSLYATIADLSSNGDSSEKIQ